MKPTAKRGSNRIRVTSIDDDNVSSIEVSEIDISLANRLATAGLDSKKDVRSSSSSSSSSTTATTLNATSSSSAVSTPESYFVEREKERAAAAIVAREREIFLRAALQLLDQKDAGLPDAANNGNNSNSNHNNNGVSWRSSALRPTRGTPDSRMDAIRFGPLRKAVRGGNWPTMSSMWKPKYVELRHGVFSYEDEAPSRYGLGGGGGEHALNKKNIALTVDTCRCRAFKIRSPQGDCVFELTLFGGPRRLWQTGSPAERDAWVSSISTAMIGSAGDFFAGDFVGKPEIPASLIGAQGLSHGLSLLAFNSNNSDHHPNHYSSTNHQDVSSDDSTISTMLSVEGAAAPYAEDISKFAR